MRLKLIIFVALFLSFSSFKSRADPGEQVPQGVFEYTLSSTAAGIHTITLKRLKTTNPSEQIREFDAFSLGQMVAKCLEENKDFSTLDGEGGGPNSSYLILNFECVEKGKVKAFHFIPQRVCQELGNNQVIVYGCYWQDKSEFFRALSRL
jgi:hypothetical protein